MILDSELKAKVDILEGILAGCGGAAVAFSGGVDSTLLLSFARDALGDGVLAVTVSAPFVPSREVDEARGIAAGLGVNHEIITADVMSLSSFRDNPTDRCYHCKKRIFSAVMGTAGERNLPCVLEASNSDDGSDYRPGLKAVRELGIRSPFMEAGLTKREIRALSRERGLGTWDKPAMACLATRIPYNEPITVEKLKQVERGEEILISAGFRSCRLRHHGAVARIEVDPGDIGRLLDMPLRGEIAERIRRLGFQYVSVDMEGYRPGSLNEPLEGGEADPGARKGSPDGY